MLKLRALIPVRFVPVRTHAAAQINGFTDIDDAIAAIIEKVNPWFFAELS